MKTISTSAFKDFLDSCSQPGCPVCRIAERETRRYLQSLFYEYVNDPGVRKELRSSVGFCNLHTWQAVDQNLGNALGFAILYADLTKHATSLLEQVSRSAVKAARLLSTQPCPACRVWEKASSAQIELVLHQLESSDLLSAMRGSEGLCLPHLTQTISMAKESEDIKSLVLMRIEKLSGLQQEIKEFIRKNDHRFMHEPAESESDSWLRALRSLAGLKKGSHD
jgi:hypothetical protein